MNRCDVLVVGGGPAGAMAALTAAERGLDVLLVERDMTIGSPVRCAEAVDEKGICEFFTPELLWTAAVITGYNLVAPDGTVTEMNMGGVRGFILEPDTEPAPQQTPAVQRDFLGFEAVSEHQEALWGRQQAAHIAESGRLGRKIVRQITGKDNAEPIQAPLALLKAIDAPAVMVEIGMEQDRNKAMESVAKGIEQYARGNR